MKCAIGHSPETRELLLSLMVQKRTEITSFPKEGGMQSIISNLFAR